MTRAGRRWRLLVAGAVLVALPVPAQAQHVPAWLIAAVLSPFGVLLLCVVLGFLARSLRAVLVHAALVLVWVLLFALAARFVENDYVIWTPLALYVLHAALVLILIIAALVSRLRNRPGPGRGPIRGRVRSKGEPWNSEP